MKAKKQKNDPLVAFLYILLRDMLVSGKVEHIMENHIEGHWADSLVYSNPHTLGHAKDIARRLRKKKK